MVKIRLDNVSNFALKSVNVTFPSGKLSVVIGPNGAGKTTMLKVIAGLVSYKGRVFFDDVCVNDLPPYRREISYVPQNNALFPNMSVRENIAFGLKVRGINVKERVDEILQTFRLEHVADKYPATLSGGEARKVALARALAINPKAILLDEPFTNLDVEMQAVVNQEIMMIARKLAKTVVMTSHSVKRAIRSAGSLHVLWKGRVVFSGNPAKLDTSVLPEDVRFWLGSVIEVDITEINGTYFAEANGFKIPITTSVQEKRGKVLIPPDSIKICKRGYIEGRVADVRRYGSYFRVCVDVGKGELYIVTPVAVSKGEKVKLKVSDVAVVGGEDEA